MALRDDSSRSESEQIALLTSRQTRILDSHARRSALRRIRKLPKYTARHYDDLPKKKGAIRLLNLLPSTTDSSEVHCELITPSNTEGSMKTYEALSWCWGTGDKNRCINIRSNGTNYAKYIGENLFHALKALRRPDKDRYLWIYAVCINQEHLNEKNHQVEMMHEIYGNAERVCIWLGEANRSSKTAIKFIKDEVLKLDDFDTLCDSKEASRKWRALLELMQRPWFSRRWVVQEIALARTALIYCGKDQISWKVFAIAVELFVEVETATHRLSEVMKRDRQGEFVPGWFEYVSALGASLLVDATERLFRDYKEGSHSSKWKSEPAQDSDSEFDTDPGSDGESTTSSNGDAHTERGNPPSQWIDVSKKKKSQIQPLLSLEYLVSSLTIFDTTVSHDTIYAFLAIAKDTTPTAAKSLVLESSDHAKAGLERFTQRKRYNVDYKLPYVDVCKEFIQFAIEQSVRIDPSRALDVICRPWATEEKVLIRAREKRRKLEEKQLRKTARMMGKTTKSDSRSDAKAEKEPGTNEQSPSSVVNDQKQGQKSVADQIEEDLQRPGDDMLLPSWIPQLSAAPFAISNRAGMVGRTMSRKNADPLVGLPSLTHRNYAAAETKSVDTKSLRFRKRNDHFSMYIKGFCLDKVKEIKETARNGQIPREWAELGGWEDAKGPPPEPLWRTLVADRGRDGKNPPVYYSRACRESFTKGGFESGAVDTTSLINYERNSVVAQFCRRVQAVVWNRALIKTTGQRLGLVNKDVQAGDMVCILYGCSVPVILRKSQRKEEKQFQEEMEREFEAMQKVVASHFIRYKARRKEHLKRRNADMVAVCRMWENEKNWRKLKGRGVWDTVKKTIEYEILGERKIKIRLDKPEEKDEGKIYLECQAHLAQCTQAALKSFMQWYVENRQSENTRDWMKRVEERQHQEEIKKARENEADKRKKAYINEVGLEELYRAYNNKQEEIALKENEADGGQEVELAQYKTDATENHRVDWFEFRTQLKFGRRWRNVIREKRRKALSDWETTGKENYSKLKQRREDIMRYKGQRWRHLVREKRQTTWKEDDSPEPIEPIGVARSETSSTLIASAFAVGNHQQERIETRSNSDNLLNDNVGFDTKVTEPERSSSGDSDRGYSGYSSVFPFTAVSSIDGGEDTGAGATTSAGIQDTDHRTVSRNASQMSMDAEEIPKDETAKAAEGVQTAGDLEFKHFRKSTTLTPEKAREYDWKIRDNLRMRLGYNGYYYYTFLGECYIHGMMDGEAMLHQNEGNKKKVIPSEVFEIR